jgi:hypothetical protein
MGTWWKIIGTDIEQLEKAQKDALKAIEKIRPKLKPDVEQRLAKVETGVKDTLDSVKKLRQFAEGA